MAGDVKQPVIDERLNLGNQPGLHVFIVGVSGYPNLLAQTSADPNPPEALGLRQLTSTSLTAYRIYQWIDAHRSQFPIPVVTCRVLLSPSAIELGVEPKLADFPTSTLRNFLQAAKDWRKDASTSAQNATLFYFAGHGIERNKGDAVLLLEEFGDGLGGALANAVDMHNIYYGMASPETGQTIAQQQLYFVDACRNLSKTIAGFEQMQATPVFNVKLADSDLRSAPIYYAAAPGTLAQAVPGEQTVFSKALLDCLEGDAAEFKSVDGEDRWAISVLSLNKALTVKVDDWNRTLGAGQYYAPDGQQIETNIRFLEQPPVAEVVIQVDPADALQVTRLEVRDGSGMLVANLPVPLDPHPYKARWPAGFYSIGATIQPPTNPYRDCPARPGLLLPPRAMKKVRVVK